VIRQLIKRERLDFPLSAVRGNIIFSGGRAAGVYRSSTINFHYLQEARKLDLHERLAGWMMSAGADFSIYRVCREYPADLYVADTINLMEEGAADRGELERLLEGHAERMRSMHSFLPEVYTVIGLQQRAQWSRLLRENKLLVDADAAALDTLNNHVRARRAHTREIQWLVRRAAVRGSHEPDVDPFWAPPALSVDGGEWEVGRADVQSFMPIITERPRSMLVEGEDGSSLQAILVMGKPPRTASYPGSAELLFAPLERLDFPVDAVAHVRWVPNKKMLTICDNSIKDARDEVNDAAARFLDKGTRRRAGEVENVQDYFASEPYPPGLETFVSFAVGAPADRPDVLEERVKRLQRAYGSVRLYRPVFLQPEFLGEHMLRPDGASSREYRRDYRRLMIAEQLAAMMPLGTNQGGSMRGFYIGHTIPGAKRPIKYNVLEASETNQAGAVLLNGTLGGGKTIAGQQLLTQAVRRGSVAVDVDPRPDHSLEQLLGDDLVHVISLDNVDDHAGRLDPLVVAMPSMREELTVSYMIDLLPKAPPEWQTEIISAVRDEMREEHASCIGVIERLLANPDENARAAGKALRVWSSWGLCRLAFGDGSTRYVDLAKPCTTIKVHGLSLPPAGTPRESYDQSERISVATFKLIVAYAMRLVSGERAQHKVLMLDEVHAFSDTADGQRFLSRLLRMARSMNVTVILLTQLIGDLERLKDLIGVVFSFRQQNSEQARANLRMLELDDSNDDLVAQLRGFSNGECLMSGLDGRVVAMQVDPDPEFLRLADTNPSRPRLVAG
jgi:AAA-like domain